MDLDQKKQIASSWFEELRNSICHELEKIESEAGSNAKFKRHSWNRDGGGGGTMSYINGEVFEKGGVNISSVHGDFSEMFRKEIPGAEENPSFWASGLSLVLHPKSPHVPIVHMNTRMIVTSKLWFGGGADLTPVFPQESDTEDFHNSMKDACDKHDPEFYPKFKERCDKYFYLPHRGETRGVGGIFYDYHNTGNWENDFEFTKDVGKAFLDIYPKIVRKHYKKSWTEQEQNDQMTKRSRYVEFNLLYDRGTKFGLMTNGNTEAILMSMPPTAKWAVNV